MVHSDLELLSSTLHHEQRIPVSSR
jgi:hypothetical protein